MCFAVSWALCRASNWLLNMFYAFGKLCADCRVNSPLWPWSVGQYLATWRSRSSIQSNACVQTNCRSAGAGRKSAQQSKHISGINGYSHSLGVELPRLLDLVSNPQSSAGKTPTWGDTNFKGAGLENTSNFELANCRNRGDGVKLLKFNEIMKN